MAGIEIPDSWMGKPIEGSVERVLSRKQNPPASAPIIPVTTNIINPRTYLKVPQYHNVLIAAEETHRGKDMYETLEALATEGLVMPTPRIFMTHWMNVKVAVVDKTNQLMYADGTAVPDVEAERLWNYMSSIDRTSFGKPAWSWLNARFTEENGQWYMQNDLKVVTDSAGKKSLQGVSQILDCPIRSDRYVELNFNSQGFPVDPAQLTSYKQGENIRFFHPRNNAVAGFVANSGRAYLGCIRDPSNRGAVLGVFACAAGNAPQNSGGSP